MSRARRLENPPATAGDDTQTEGFPESQASLWKLTAGPAIWATHFVLSYVTVAIWCEKARAIAAPLGGARAAVAVYTAVALVAISAAAFRGYRQHSYGASPPPHDEDSPEDRHRFLGFATLLLCGLAFVATVYVALAIIFIESCR